MKKMVAYVASGALMLWAAVCLAAGNPAKSGQISINDFTFTPQILTVKAGTTVTWTNRDDEPHTVVSAAKKFRSSVLDTNGKFSYTFSDPGTYEYFCSVHPHMTGKVIVK